MKHSIIRYSLIASLLAAGLSFTALPSAEAKSSKRQVKRCLSGTYRVSVRGNENIFTNLGVFLGTNRVNVRGGLGIRGRGANFRGLNFRFQRISVRGSKKMVIRGRTRLNGFINNQPGFLKLVLKKKGTRAKITTGNFRYIGQNPITGNVHQVLGGRISGSKRLSKKCQH